MTKSMTDQWEATITVDGSSRYDYQIKAVFDDLPGYGRYEVCLLPSRGENTFFCEPESMKKYFQQTPSGRAMLAFDPCLPYRMALLASVWEERMAMVPAT